MDKKRFILNLLIYLAILIGGIILYNPFKASQDNPTTSTVKFIYADF